MSSFPRLLTCLLLAAACGSAPSKSTSPTSAPAAETEPQTEQAPTSGASAETPKSTAATHKPASARCQDLIPFVSDEESMEKALEAVWSSKLGHTVMSIRRPKHRDDLYLQASFSGNDKRPSFRVLVNTQRSARDNSERVIILSLVTRLIVPPEKHAEVLKLINHYHDDTWGGIFTINPNDNEIEAQWMLNTHRGVGLCPVVFTDTIARLLQSWKGLSEILVDCESCTKPIEL